MLNVRLSALVIAGLSVVCASRAVTIVEDFSTDPQPNGWQVFGDTNLFYWNATNQNLEVTWDSTRPNSYFYHPLNVTLTRRDDFTLEFDLRLIDIASGVEPGKTGPMQIGIGFLNLAAATDASFMRGAWGGAPNVAEFAYYTWGYYEYEGDVHASPNSTVPSFIPGTDPYHYAPGASLSPFAAELPTNQMVHIRLAYTGSDQSAAVSVTTNGVPLREFAPLVLTDPGNSQFTPADNFRVNIFSISSYSSNGDYYDSVLAHGVLDNLTVTAQLQAIGRLTGGPTTNGLWGAQFFSRSNWVYTLERTTDLKSWRSVSTTLRGTEDYLTLQETNTLPARAFYRVRAD